MDSAAEKALRSIGYQGPFDRTDQFIDLAFRMFNAGRASRDGLIEALKEIGNLIGAPLGAFGPSFTEVVMLDRIQKTSKLVQKALAEDDGGKA